MGLFDIFKKKTDNTVSANKTAPETLAKPEITENQVSKKELVEKLIKLVQEKTQKPCFNLEINEEETPDLFSTKIGGKPYWDNSLPYPKDKEENPLALVLQINFADLQTTKNQIDAENLLPSEGILQFFISPEDDYYGMDFDNYKNQDKFRIIFHKSIDESLTEPKLPENLPEGFGPVQGEVKLVVKPSTSYLSLDSEQFQEIFQESVQEIFGEETEDDYRSYLDNKNFDNGNKYGRQFFKALSNQECYLLGNPAFTQEDPRSSLSSEEAQFFDTLLFKLDSSDYLMWGDTGICNLFINKEALKALDFSKVLYYWDCC